MTVFLHGLGLDSNDYSDYLAEQKDEHGLAITLPGFSRTEKNSAPPIPLSTHVEVVSDFITEVAEKNPQKDLVLVGFSLGADMILLLAEHWKNCGSRAPRLAGALLLDPNVNQSTMSISKLFARSDPANPLPAFKELINLAQDRDLFQALCVYLAKIARKDFFQLWQLSRDMIEYWKPDGYSQIGERLATVAEIFQNVRVVLSAAYETHLPAVQESALRHNAPTVSFRLTKLDHFDLISSQVLSSELQLIR
ncbi:alpha/beta fold hydrolase [Streptosporangium sp. NPDC006013]|uniref:alpha/beta fold hydrolase n=1 Tax=Streptosporangium sp. NPDC006013 TaxID=3155596 RepID=UPI0033AEEA00